MAGRAKKPFVSRKRRKEIVEARERRETQIQAQHERVQSEGQQYVRTEKASVQIPAVATVGEFAQLLKVPVVAVIKQLMKNGVMAAINHSIDFDTMSIVADELGFVPEVATETEVTAASTPTQFSTTDGVARPPIVTIMGHVDHGKTSLLDKIRQTNVAGGEAGGITQHIGAYQAEVTYEGAPRLVTLLDTPGHEAFTALRSHGAQVTDIVVLVVAADDGVKPQTIEAVNHAKSSGVPIIVAINKMDLPGANPERIKQQLTELSLVPEEWGGTTIMTGVSAHTGEGIQGLLEYIVLTADLKNIKADPKAPTQGVIIESHQEVGLGPVATVLVQNGTLHVGDVIVIGQTYGKVRTMQNYLGKRITSAKPGTPVRIAGLQDIPNFGETFAYVESEKDARELALKAQESQPQRRTISEISQAIAEGRLDTFNIVLKVDAQGSLEALRQSIGKLQAPGVKARIIHGAVGDITLTDLQLAAASNAVVYGFNVTVSPQVKKAADNLGVTVSSFKIIYDMLNLIELALKGLVKTEKILVERGRLKVLKVFRTTKEAQIIGGEITQGVALKKAQLTLMRSGEEVGKGRVLALQKGPESVDELQAPEQCGVSVSLSDKVREGDMIIFYSEEEVIANAAATA